MWTTTEVKDAIVQLEETLWVRVSAIEALRPYVLKDGRTEILLRSGNMVSTTKTMDEVVELVRTAMRPTQPTFGGQ